MKKTLLIAAGALLAATLSAAPLPVVNVDSTNITCLFSTSCVVTVDDSTSPIVLPNTTGEGFLQTRTFEGGAGSEAEGLFAYLYRIDLTGLTAVTNGQCFSNRVTCSTNFVLVTNRVVVCTNAAGSNVCVTNFVITPTNRLTCVTNVVPCTNVAPCVSSLQLRFGPAWGVLASNGAATGQVFVVTSGGIGTEVPTSVLQTGAVLTINFTNPVCAGESSVFFGLISSNAPRDVIAVARLTTGSNILVGARAPGRPPIQCDFSALRTAIQQLTSSGLLAPNDNAREGRRGALLNAIRAATEAAAEGDAEGVLEAFDSIAAKTR